MAMVAAALLAAACGNSKDKPAEPAESQAKAEPETVAQPGTPGVCPGEDELAKQLGPLWNVGPDQRVAVQGCVGGAFPEPGYYAIAFIDAGGDPDWPEESQLRHDLVGADGKLLTNNPPQELAPAERNGAYSWSDLAVVDFDGDGAHEVVQHEGFEYRDVMSTDYQVLYRRGAVLEQAISVPLAHDVSNEAWIDDEEEDGIASISCEATAEVVDRKLVVTGKVNRVGDQKELSVDGDHCIEGTKTFVMKDGKLVPEAG
jgi:hypothetical protein